MNRAIEHHGAMTSLAALLATLMLSGCGGTRELVVEQALAKRLPPKGIVILPVAVMTPDGSALECIARTRDVANYLLANTETPLIGPADYRVFKEPDEMRVASIDTDLMTRATGTRIDMRNWLAVFVMVTENRATNIRDIVDKRSKKKQTFRQYGIDSTVKIEVQVLDARYGKPFARVVITDKDDPTKVRTEGDPRPIIKELIEAALAVALSKAEDTFTKAGKSRRIRGREFLDSVPLLADWGTAGRPSFNAKRKDKEDIVKQAALEALWTRFQPELPVKATFVGTRHHGVMALKARAPLQQYDVVKTIDGRPVTTSYQLDRALQSCRKACNAMVRRGFKNVEVDLTWPPAPPLPPEDE